MSVLVESETVQRMCEHLAALPGGVGCRHLAREEHDLDASLLVDLALVKLLMTRVPTCADHGCPRSGACPWEADFLPGASGAKAGVKYRCTADGEAVAAGNVAAIEERLAALPLATAVLHALATKPLTLFALQWGFVEEARVAVRAGTNTERVAPNRPALLSVVHLLADLGVVELSEDGGVRRR